MLIYMCIDPVLINNTITRNRCQSGSPFERAAGLEVFPGAFCYGENNIIKDNFALTSPDYSGNVNFIYSNVGGGLPGIGNFDLNPEYMHTPPAAYCFLNQVAAGQLLDSPCVDAGNPAAPMITGATRSDWVQDTGVVDQGFHWTYSLIYSVLDIPGIDEFLPPIGPVQNPELCSTPNSIDLDVFNYPNPFNPITTINLAVDQISQVRLIVYDVTGRVVSSLYEGQLDAGVHEFEFSRAYLPSCVYTYRA